MNYFKLISIFFILFSTMSNAEILVKEQTVSPRVKQSLSDFKLCDINALAESLDKEFAVVYLKDEQANYNYYLIRNHYDMNVDKVRHAACDYIVKNKCYIYWGNVANMAMIAEKQAAWFPTDTSPHYLLSPVITCDKHAMESR